MDPFCSWFLFVVLIAGCAVMGFRALRSHRRAQSSNRIEAEREALLKEFRHANALVYAAEQNMDFEAMREAREKMEAVQARMDILRLQTHLERTADQGKFVRKGGAK
jgi:Tfp pilus assembly protein PilX